MRGKNGGEDIVAYFEVLSRQFPGETKAEENHTNLVRIAGDLPKFKSSTSQTQVSCTVT